MTSQEPRTAQSADRDILDTEVIVVSAPTPVFVDSTGRRRRHLRRLAYGFGAICVLYGGLISVSLAGGPVRSSAILPLPDLTDHENERVDAQPSPTPAPTFSAPPKTRFIGESLRRSPPFTSQDNRDVAARRPAATPATSAKQPKSKAPAPTVTPTRPVASTGPPSVTPSPSATGSVVPPKPPTVKPTTIPVPPSPPSAGGVGGGVGGDSVPDTDLAPTSGLTPDTELMPTSGPTPDTELIQPTELTPPTQAPPSETGAENTAEPNEPQPSAGAEEAA